MQIRRFNAGGRNSPAPRRYKGLDEGKPPAAFRYIRLECNHLTTPEDQEAYRLWRPKKGVYYCEHKCSRWVRPMPKPKPARLPDTPLF